MRARLQASLPRGSRAALAPAYLGAPHLSRGMVLVDLAAGTAAGVGICVVGHPFDTMKVLMQSAPAAYKGMGDAARQIVARKGLAGLYEGVASPLVGSGLFNAIQFAAFSNAKAALTDGGRNVTLNRIAAAAGVTGVIVALVEGPQDLFKSQMQAQMQRAELQPGTPLKYTSTLGCVRAIVAERGPLGVFQGLGVTVARNAVGVSAYFYFYEAARLRFAAGAPVSTLSPGAVMVAGGLGGLGYWVLCYPLDIVKTAVQTDAIAPAARKYAGALDAAAKLWAEGGARRFTAGLAPCLARAFPANAVGFLVYEAVKNALEPPAPAPSRA